MMRELNNKRLLVLGGNSWAEAIKEYTQKNGITMVAAGNNINTKLFMLADETYDINTTDKEKMKEFIISKRIDGVYLGGNESVIAKACEYVNELGLPCYCNKKQWECMQNKSLFKKCCIEAGLPVVSQYVLDEKFISLPDDAFPVITKPVDGCGSNGFSVCNNNMELVDGIERAKLYSESGSIIVEKYVNNSGHVVFYTVTNGKIYFSGISDKYPVKFQKQGSYVGGLFVYESKFAAEFRDKFENSIQKMVDNLDIKEGTFWIEVFHDGNAYYFNEAGFRYGGSVSIYPVDYLHKINQVASDIYFCLTGESKIIGHDSLFDQSVPKKSNYAIYPVYVSEGVICSIGGKDELMNNENIVKVIQTKEDGTVIIDTGSFGQAVLLVHLIFNKTEELLQILDFVHRTIKIHDKNGNNIVTRMVFDGLINEKEISYEK